MPDKTVWAHESRWQAVIDARAKYQLSPDDFKLAQQYLRTIRDAGMYELWAEAYTGISANHEGWNVWLWDSEAPADMRGKLDYAIRQLRDRPADPPIPVEWGDAWDKWLVSNGVQRGADGFSPTEPLVRLTRPSAKQQLASTPTFSPLESQLAVGTMVLMSDVFNQVYSSNILKKPNWTPEQHRAAVADAIYGTFAAWDVAARTGQSYEAVFRTVADKPWIPKTITGDVDLAAIASIIKVFDVGASKDPNAWNTARDVITGTTPGAQEFAAYMKDGKLVGTGMVPTITTDATGAQSLTLVAPSGQSNDKRKTEILDWLKRNGVETTTADITTLLDGGSWTLTDAELRGPAYVALWWSLQPSNHGLLVPASEVKEAMVRLVKSSSLDAAAKAELLRDPQKLVDRYLDSQVSVDGISPRPYVERSLPQDWFTSEVLPAFNGSIDPETGELLPGLEPAAAVFNRQGYAPNHANEMAYSLRRTPGESPSHYIWRMDRMKEAVERNGELLGFKDSWESVTPYLDQEVMTVLSVRENPNLKGTVEQVLATQYFAATNLVDAEVSTAMLSDMGYLPRKPIDLSNIPQWFTDQLKVNAKNYADNSTQAFGGAATDPRTSSLAGNDFRNGRYNASAWDMYYNSYLRNGDTLWQQFAQSLPAVPTTPLTDAEVADITANFQASAETLDAYTSTAIMDADLNAVVSQAQQRKQRQLQEQADREAAKQFLGAAVPGSGSNVIDEFSRPQPDLVLSSAASASQSAWQRQLDVERKFSELQKSFATTATAAEDADITPEQQSRAAQFQQQELASAWGDVELARQQYLSLQESSAPAPLAAPLTPEQQEAAQRHSARSPFIAPVLRRR